MITTVILVAVGIALAVAIGLWMSGLVATFTRFEKLEVTSAYATGSGPWTVKVTVKNTGSADATITSVMVNGIPTTDIGGITLTPVLPASVSVGSNQTFTISIPANQPIRSWKRLSCFSHTTIILIFIFSILLVFFLKVITINFLF